jgi:hypothetical protein
MMFKRVVILVSVALLLLLAGTAVLAAEGYEWRNHADPFNNTFGNLIDTHQQSQQVGGDMLQGYIYIQFTGEERDGVPEAVRADCTNPTLDCSLGWKFKAIPIEAKLVSKGPRVWQVDAGDLPDGPQYAHFHWNGIPTKPCGLVIGETYEGYLMQRTAVSTFFWLGGNPNKGPGGPVGSGGSDDHHEDGGCSGHDGTDETHDEGGCSGHDGTDETHDEGGCSGHDGGDTSHDSGSSGDHGGHLVTPGIDDRANIVTHWDGSNDDGHGGPPGGTGGTGGSGGHDDGGCSEHEETDEGCSGHETTGAG